MVNFLCLSIKGVTSNELKKNSLNAYLEWISKIDIYVFKTRFDITTLPKVDFPHSSIDKESVCSAGDLSLILGLGIRKW